MRKVAVAILNWNGEELLKQFLPSVEKNSPDDSVFVIDNGSTDESLSTLKQSFPSVNVIALDKNYGFSEGYNKGLAMIECEIAVMLNSDVEVTSGWLEPLIKTFEIESEVGAVQPKIKAFKEKSSFEYAGAAGGFLDSYGYPFCRGRIFNRLEEDQGQYDSRQRIFWASGACLVIRKDMYFKAGGLDPIFFAHMEEIDLCWRLNRMGLNIYVEPASEVFHVGGASLEQGDPRKTYLNFRNNLILLAKNLKGWDFYRILIARLILDGFAGIKFLFGGSPAECLAVVRAHFSFYNTSRGIRTGNRDIKKPKMKELPGILNGLLPWRFFVLKQTKFDQLGINNPK